MKSCLICNEPKRPVGKLCEKHHSQWAESTELRRAVSLDKGKVTDRVRAAAMDFVNRVVAEDRNGR